MQIWGWKGWGQGAELIEHLRVDSVIMQDHKAHVELRKCTSLIYIEKDQIKSIMFPINGVYIY